MDRRFFLKACGGCALALSSQAALDLGFPGNARAMPSAEKGFIRPYLSPYFQKFGEAVQCSLCPRRCMMQKGERGYCEVRENQGGELVSLVYGNPCAVAVDPVEKKPFFHVLPGSASFSIATAGCNFDCKYCQNWEISQARPEKTYNYDLPPQAVVDMAEKYQCRSIASTYVEPTIFTEYMLAMGRLAKERGILKVMHSNGFINAEPLADLCQILAAACIDLKGFTDDYYAEVTEGSLQPVLDSLRLMRRSGLHLELVTLIVPGKNDDMQVLADMCRWVGDELGPDTPLHLTRFTPRYKYKSLPPTPLATLERAHETAKKAGLNFVYIGNVPGHPAESTICPKCGETVIERVGFVSNVRGLKAGACAKCGRVIPGIWD